MAYWFSRGLLILAVAVFLGAALWKLPQYQVGRSTGLTPENQFNRENEARKTLAQILGGLALLFGLYLTWRRITAAEKTAEATLKSAETALQNVRVAQDSQITERFTRAIGQLGHDKLEIRLGGIYALERIARDSEMDHWPVMEVLTAYVRENAPWKENSSPSKQDGAPNPRTDVQAILTVLGRRQRSYEKEGQILDLRKTNLRTAYLEEVHLEKAYLLGAHLEKAYLLKAYLEKARLSGAHLEGANLSGAHLEKADLLGAHLEKARLSGAHLEGANLSGAHLEKADLLGAHLEKATLAAAHLEDANLIGAHLQDAVLLKAYLEKATLEDAHLEKAYLVEAHLTQEQINQASGDKETTLPEGLQTPKHWLKDSETQ